MSAIVINPSTQQLERVQGKTWIVLVGVNHYQDPQILDLRYCANDCKELADTLKIVTQQFQKTEIIALYDGGDKPPNKLEINNSIQNFRLAKPEDTVLFYFSGHGYLDSNNRPILCVRDTNLEDLAETGLKLDTLLNELRQCKAQRQLVWLDACQEREQQQDNIIRQNPTGQLLAVLEQQAEQSQDFYAMLSCNKTERSWEIPELKHGLFTYCLIEGLRGKAANTEGKIDADSLFKYVERSSKKFIEYKKNPLNQDSFSKGMRIPTSEATKLKVKQLPPDASQTPQRIARGSGELIIGLANFSTARKALIIDNLSSSLVDISLCKILKSRGNFEVDYCFVRDKHTQNIQQNITSFLHQDINQTVLLYLSGTIESTNSETYELICNHDNRINLNLLGQQLQDSPVKEIVIIADILDTSETNKSLVEILQPNQDKSLCLITSTSSVANNKKLLHELVTVLETAGELEREFWVAELITQLQKWGASQGDVNLKLWLSGSTEVMDILSVEAQRSYNEIFEINVCPYKSLEAFTQDDAYFFHGREELIAEIIEKLESTSFLAVVGASGSGKSSVVRAGVIPKLVTEGLFDSELEQSKSCQSWVMLPGDNPLAALAKTLAPDNPDFLEGVLHLGVDSLVEWLRQQPKEISVLVIDQFEELFTLTAETDRVNFLSLILGAIKKARNCFKVIITLRSDFLDECLGMSELAPLITKSQVLVPSCRLEDKQYRQIIAKPAQKVGLDVEDGLIALLLEELKEGSLPLLQYALEELWHKRSRGKLTVKDYQQYIGKLGKFLSNKAQETYDNLNEAQQECAQSIFLSLVFLVEGQDDSNKDTRRRLPVSKLSVNKYKNVLDSTLQTLINARLIVVSGEENNLSLVNQEQLNADNDKQNQQINDLAIAAEVDGENINNQSKDKITVEIAHEILLRDWETLKWWLDENREKYRLIREINQKADEWKQNGKRDGFLLSKGALAKYEEFYVNYADELSGNSNEFIDVSIQARDKAEKLAKRRQRQITGGLAGGIVAISMALGAVLWQLHRATINEINALSNSAEALLASNQELDALVTGLKAGRKIKNNFWGVDNITKIKIVGGLQNIFYQLKELNRLEGHTASITSVVFSPDGKTIASASNDNTVKLWNLNGQLLHTLEGHTKKFLDRETIRQVVFSPDGKTIASFGDDNRVKLWNLNGQFLHALEGHESNVGYVVFSPDGQTIASAGGRHSTIKLWNLNGQLLNTFEAEGPFVSSVVFSSDGKTIASA
ncbi:MAG: caspase family protein, partial [Gloeotrichia echinulata HAB0833]